MKKPFFWLMTALFALLALGIWLLVMGIQSSPFASPFASSI